jgi:uncharacterized membrane protein YozB (DUF420 family)
MKNDRYFYSLTSLGLLLLMLVGFHQFFLGGREADGTSIPQPILAFVLIHGLALTAWVVLFFVQALLIAAKKRSVHMKLGWAAAAVALVIAVSGPVVAVAAPSFRPPGKHLYGMTYHQFMLPMLTEIMMFTLFVALGLYWRKKPAIHRSLMLLATLSVISGATARTEMIHNAFGGRGWVGLFGRPHHHDPFVRPVVRGRVCRDGGRLHRGDEPGGECAMDAPRRTHHPTLNGGVQNGVRPHLAAYRGERLACIDAEAKAKPAMGWRNSHRVRCWLPMAC